MVVRDPNEKINETEHAERYVGRINDALTNFSVILKENMDVNSADLKEIFELASIPLPANPCDNYEASDRMIEINQKMLSLLISYHQLADNTKNLTNRLNSAEQQLSDVVNSTTWRATKNMRGFVSRYPSLSRLIRRIIILLGWINNGTFFHHLKLYLAHRKRKAIVTAHSAGLDSQQATLDETMLPMGEPKAISPSIRFVPTLSVVLYLSPDSMRRAVSCLLDLVPTDWELVIVGAAEKWNLSHPLLRYVSMGSSLYSEITLDEIAGKTFGRFVVFVGDAESEEERAIKHLSHEWNIEIRNEMTRLTQLINQIDGTKKAMLIQRFWRRPE